MTNPWDSFKGWMQTGTPQRSGTLSDEQLATYDAQAARDKLAQRQAVLKALQAQAVAPQDTQQFVRSNVGTFYTGPNAASQLARVAQMALTMKGLNNAAADQAQNNTDSIDATKYILDHKPEAQSSYTYKNPNDVGPVNQTQGTSGMTPVAPPQQPAQDMSVSTAPVQTQDGALPPEESLGLGGSLGPLGSQGSVQPTPVTPAVKSAVAKAMGNQASTAPAPALAPADSRIPNLKVPPKVDLRATANKAMGASGLSPDDITFSSNLFAQNPPAAAAGAPNASTAPVAGGGQFNGHGASASWADDTTSDPTSNATRAAAVIKASQPQDTSTPPAVTQPVQQPVQDTAGQQSSTAPAPATQPSTADTFNVTTKEPTAGEHAAWLAQLARSGPMGQAIADRMMGSKGEYAIQDGYLINKNTGQVQKLDGNPAEMGRHLEAVKQLYSGVTDAKSLAEANQRLHDIGVPTSYLTNDVQAARRSGGQTDAIAKENESATSYDNAMANYTKTKAMLDGVISNPDTIKQAKGDIANNIAAHLPWATDTAEARSKIKEGLSGMVMASMQAMKQSGVGTGAFNSDKEGERLQAALADIDFAHLGTEALQAKVNSLRLQADDAMARLNAARARNVPGTPAAATAPSSSKSGNGVLDFSRK